MLEIFSSPRTSAFREKYKLNKLYLPRNSINGFTCRFMCEWKCFCFALWLKKLRDLGTCGLFYIWDSAHYINRIKNKSHKPKCLFSYRANDFAYCKSVNINEGLCHREHPLPPFGDSVSDAGAVERSPGNLQWMRYEYWIVGNFKIKVFFQFVVRLIYFTVVHFAYIKFLVSKWC